MERRTYKVTLYDEVYYISMTPDQLKVLDFLKRLGHDIDYILPEQCNPIVL